AFYELGDAEIQQLDLTVRCNQNVRWFQIAMNDQMRVGVLHSVQYLKEQRKPCANLQLALIAIAIDCDALDEFQDKKRPCLFVNSSIIEAGDSAMSEAG